jgi:hypothetical protein
VSDIFISSARSAASQAHAVAEALRALGYSVWRDDEPPSHRTYSDVIEEQLQSAEAAVVIWPAEAAAKPADGAGGRRPVRVGLGKSLCAAPAACTR